MKKKKLTYIIAFFIICLIPTLLMPIFGFQGAESEDSVKRFPKLITASGINSNFLSEAGDYFAYNFAFRQQMVTAQGVLQTKLLRSSSEESVIAGREGWLFYESTLPDYLGEETLSDVQLYDISYNLKCMREILADSGKSFAFTIAPNKNSLYPQYMRKGYKRSKGTDNYTRLLPYLESSGVNYVNLHELFQKDDRVLYHSGDSHWNNLGAAMAAESILDSVSIPHRVYEEEEYVTRHDFVGDLAKMIYPSAKDLEDEYYFVNGFSYSYDKPIKSTYDPEIETTGTEEDGDVVMFRDSFGNTLLPFIATEFREGFFSRGVPYQMYMADDFDGDEEIVVLVEVVERNLKFLAQSAPIIAEDSLTELEVEADVVSDYHGELSWTDSYSGGNTDYPFIKIAGKADDRYKRSGTFSWLVFTDKATGKQWQFRAFHTCEGDATESGAELGICAYVDPGILPDGNYEVSVMHENNGVYSISSSLMEYEVTGSKVKIEAEAEEKPEAEDAKSEEVKEEAEEDEKEAEEEASEEEETEVEEEKDKEDKKSDEDKKKDDKKKDEEKKKKEEEKKKKEEEKKKKEEEKKKKEEEEKIAKRKKTAEDCMGQSIDVLIGKLGQPKSFSIDPGCNATGGDDGIYKWDGITVYTSSEEPGGDQIIIYVE